MLVLGKYEQQGIFTTKGTILSKAYELGAVGASGLSRPPQKGSP